MAKNCMYLYGKNSVIERLKASPESIHKIYLQDNFGDSKLLGLIKSRNIPVQRVGEKRLFGIKSADRLQGIVAEADDFQYAQFKDLLDNESLSLLLLDTIQDPHNLGAIIRTAACFGNFAVVIPKYNSCEVNETVLHVASGGENFVPISMVTNLSTAIIQAKKEGFWGVGAVVEGGQDINSVDLPFPLCLVLGSEGEGIRDGLANQLELKVKIPMKGASLSFNVAMASSIICYEITRQRGK